MREVPRKAGVYYYNKKMGIRKAEGERRSTSFPLEDDRHISRLARKGSLELWGYRNSYLHRRDSQGYGMKAVIPGELEVTSLSLGAPWNPK